MHQNFPKTSDGQWLKCVEFCQVMLKEFPELRLKKGCVSSYDNIDNPHPKYPKQYPHNWLLDKDENIIDPTIKQFERIGELVYEVWETEPTGKCSGCGQWHFSMNYDCGKCEWSEAPVSPYHLGGCV